MDLDFLEYILPYYVKYENFATLVDIRAILCNCIVRYISNQLAYRISTCLLYASYLFQRPTKTMFPNQQRTSSNVLQCAPNT